MLAVLTAEQLRHAVFPIGDTPKPQIRDEAARRGLAVADKPDSHDICFIPSGDTRAFLGARIGVRRGAVVDADGTVLAEHDGVHGFTIGQRKGLGIAGPGPDGRPRYVTAIDADTGTVQVGDVADLEVRDAGRRAAGVHLGRRADAARWSARCRCARTAESADAVAELRRRRAASCDCAPRCAVSRRARRWCSTGPIPTATRCSAARRSRGTSR